ncbi:MAG: hypothetical protein V4773_19385 [Verrucomicrobiota bacterium]
MNRYEHTAVILHFEEKDFAAKRSEVLQGLAPQSAKRMDELGGEGWELVSVVPYVASSARLMRQPGTDAAVGFFKRVKVG